MSVSWKAVHGMFGIVFFVVLVGFTAMNLKYEGEKILESIEMVLPEKEKEGLGEVFSEVEVILGEKLFGRQQMLEVYGGFQRLLGKKEDDAFDTVKDKDGFLYSGNFWNDFGEDQKELAMRVRRLSDALMEKGTKTGVIIYPVNKVEPKNRYHGIPYREYEETVEDFAGWIRYYRIPLLDLSNFCELTGMEQEQLFFRTDHHWTPRAAFEGYIRVLDFMNTEFEAGLDPQQVYRDRVFYEERTFENLMLGSKGRASGLVWSSGAEDFTALYPKQEGRYTLYWGDFMEQKMLEGNFTETLLELNNLEHPKGDIYSGIAENAYLQKGVSLYTSIVNHEVENGPKILLIRDSFSTIIGAFLAQNFSQVDMVWHVEVKEEELEKLLEENQYDYVLVAMYPTNLNADAFPFGMEAG